MLHHVFNEEYTRKRTVAYRLTNGVIVKHTIQTEHTSNSSEREAHTQWYAWREAHRQHSHHAEVVTKRHDEHCSHTELLKYAKLHGTEEFLLFIVVAYECRTLDYFAVDSDADTLWELELKVKVEVTKRKLTVIALLE